MKTKSTLFALVAGLAMASSANGMVIIAGWYEFKAGVTSNLADEPVGSSAQQTFGALIPLASNNDGISNGGTSHTNYGGMIPFANPGADAKGYLKTGEGVLGSSQPGLIQLAITNTSSTIYKLDYLFFDALQSPGSQGETEIFINEGSGFSDTRMISGVSTNPAVGVTEAYEQFAVSLNGLPFAPGDSYAFRLQVLDGNIRLDNMAFGASPIPEPTNVMALALLLTSGVMFRNRRRKA